MTRNSTSLVTAIIAARPFSAALMSPVTDLPVQRVCERGAYGVSKPEQPWHLPISVKPNGTQTHGLPSEPPMV